ncbi:hypothetical protein [Noviherbaspirillum autotrophicum]|uniref:Prokaryotic cytochrome C oxidase subunit IV family protein n=1 Tax=Noviherbaspirillum autotrophicum TaxID=709839 RepID=A0A0C1YN80_9BURK|nr:hypothetical protein [Noviherbaspirillum autotrophicum]KIF81641.1 hypothetical protein TSA66_13920 [Noviherbaspirillum autotrophicum]KIF82002.1 hypothetical protein TSA66_16255 [Noviherbaspirillum autotrophicum]KIF84112.1 hypothetical protein TSA66_00780 [Noviherbaspirillum autotrophicum]
MNQTTKKSLPVPAWLALLALTGISLLLGQKVGHASWMPFVVAAVMWLKGTVVTRYFLESRSAHPFIAWLLRGFVAIAPVALLLTTLLQK